MDNKIEKPLILIRKEFTENMIKIIQESNLPAFLIEPILRDVLNEIQMASKIEYDKSLELYNQKVTSPNK